MQPIGAPQTPVECPLAPALAQQLRRSRRELATTWLDRIASRVSLDSNQVFPSDELLDHVPLLIDGVADFLESPAAEISADAGVVAKAMELGALRHGQGFDAHEILKEYEILGGILFNDLARAADEMPEPCAKSELLFCGQRVFQAVAIIQQTTTDHFLRLAEERVADREERLRAFNRTMSHEIKNRLGAVLGASDILDTVENLASEDRVKLVRVISTNARAMRDSVAGLLALFREEQDARQHHNVRLEEAATEACRQVRETAQAAGVELRIAPGMPDVEVNAAGVELCLTNYLSNAIKYADPAKRARFAEISAGIEERKPGIREVVVRVRDNGIGVPMEKRQRLFQRFFRAHELSTNAEGTGLGLNIVRETAESMGGEAWAEFTGEGSVFAFSLPHRRDRD